MSIDVACLTDEFGHEGTPEETLEMKNSLLATVAAVALIAGASAASAAEGAKEQPKAAAPAGQSEMQKAPDTKAGADVKGKAEMRSEKAKPSTTGAGAADEKAGAKTEMNEKAGSKSEMNKSEKSDTKSMDNKKAMDDKSKMDSKSKSSASEQKMAPGGKSAADSKSSTDSKTTGQGSAGAKSSSVTLTSEQKTKVRTTVIESKGAPKVSRSSINFNISVGTVVPRDRVHYVAVTPTLIEIHPEWRGHMYFVVDDEIIIVDSSGRIVAVLDV
jgi:uncharacterized protein DUF1236